MMLLITPMLLRTAATSTMRLAMMMVGGGWEVNEWVGRGRQRERERGVGGGRKKERILIKEIIKSGIEEKNKEKTS